MRRKNHVYAEKNSIDVEKIFIDAEYCDPRKKWVLLTTEVGRLFHALSDLSSDLSWKLWEEYVENLQKTLPCDLGGNENILIYYTK